MTDFDRYINKLLNERKISKMKRMICESNDDHYFCTDDCPLNGICHDEKRLEDFFYKNTMSRD